MSFAHEFPFDPTYGHDLEALLRVPAPPDPPDFAAFWQGRYREARSVSPQAVLRPAGGTDTVEVFDVEFTSWGGIRIGGWLTRPRNGKVERGVVVGHGYGGRDQPDVALPIPHAAVIFPCLRGQSRSRQTGIPEDSMRHVLHGIESRETYVHGGCAADIWCAASALVELVPEAGQRLDYLGGSFGGGIGALALPWDDRFTAAQLSVPSFGNHPLRVTLPCVGSGEAVRRLWATHPEVLDVLAYFDAATAARHIEIPVLVAAALFDPAVPPPGQFAVYNAIPDPKELFVLAAGHFPYANETEENARLNRHLARFFAA
ncbi:MAG: acetylxylan esterase [Armatimonadota bacterium]